MRRAAGLVLALAGLVDLAAAQALTIGSSLVVRTAPRTDAPEVAALLGGVRANAAAADGAPGWARLTAADGRELGFVWQQDLDAAPVRTSRLAGALGGAAAVPASPATLAGPAAPAAAAATASASASASASAADSDASAGPASPPAAGAPVAARTSRLVGALTGGLGRPVTPDASPSAGSPTSASERGGALSGFLQSGGGGSADQLGLSALMDGRLAQAQAAHAEEQRRLAEIAEAERQAAEAERLARAAADEARQRMEQMEREQQRAEERRRERESDAIIGNAIMGAALSIGNAMADSLRASHARMLAENQQRMAQANQRAAEQRAIAARAEAQRAKQEASAAAARARQPGLGQSQQQTARVDYTARAQAQRAAEANFQQQQAALQQAQRNAALALQNQVTALNRSSGGGSLGAGGMRSPGDDRGSASESVSPSTTIAAGPSPASVVGLDINYHYVGKGSGTRQVAQLEVALTIRDVNVNGDKSRICAEFRNPLAGEWRGGVRLTARYEDRTHSRLSVGPGQTVTYCEILPVVKTYYVVLRQDGPPRSRDSTFGVRG